jgi:DNA-binding PadR family transcriptional regulator
MSQVETTSPEPGVARELTAFQRNILTILAEESRYGLAIKRELEAYYGDEVNHGRLYPNLDELVELELIEKSELDKRTNEYALTDQGLEAVLQQLSWTFSKVGGDGDRTDRLRSLVETHA